MLLRLFGGQRGADVGQKTVQETAVFTMLAERGLGPGLHGVFPGGRLEEFIPSRPLGTDEMRAPAYSRQIAHGVALVHSLTVPVSKEPAWLASTLLGYADEMGTLRPEGADSRERKAAVRLASFNFKVSRRTSLDTTSLGHTDLPSGLTNIYIINDPKCT